MAKRTSPYVDTSALIAFGDPSARTATCWSTDFHLGLTGVPLVIHQQ